MLAHGIIICDILRAARTFSHSLGDYLDPFCLRFSCIYACMNRASHVALEMRGWPRERVSINISAEKSPSPAPTCAKRSRLARLRELSLGSAVVVYSMELAWVWSLTLYLFCQYCIYENNTALTLHNNAQKIFKSIENNSENYNRPFFMNCHWTWITYKCNS